MTTFEVERFPDKRLKLVVRFKQARNFRIDSGTGEATWVPTLEETNQLYETLVMTNSYNLNKSKLEELSKH